MTSEVCFDDSFATSTYVCFFCQEGIKSKNKIIINLECVFKHQEKNCIRNPTAVFLTKAILKSIDLTLIVYADKYFQQSF